MLATMKTMVVEAARTNKVVPGFNVFGYEDAQAVIEVAEELNAPVILMTNKDAVDHMDIKHFAALYRSLAVESKVPVCLHLDHGKNFEQCAKAILAGYTSVMYDGSQLPIDENIKKTKEVVKLAHACGISVEAEIGSVGYTNSKNERESIYTNVEEAKKFAAVIGVDALAVAIGSLHRMTSQEAIIQFDRLKEIEKCTDVPLVIHGSTGITDDDLIQLTKHKIGKINIGTALRMAFVNTLRDEINANLGDYDRLNFYKQSMEATKKVIRNKYKLLGW